MSWIDRLFRRRRICDDLPDEIQAHLDERTEALVANGMSREEARIAARRMFGNVTVIEERSRETWEWPAIESLLMDVRYAIRQLRKAPALSLIVVLTLASGIAATATVFSWTREVLLDPLPGAGEPQRVQALETTTAAGDWTGTSWLDYRDFRQYSKSFAGLAAAYPTSVALGDESHTERRWAELVSANFFDVLEVRPALGRFFATDADDAPGSEPTVVIGHQLWQARWRGDSAVIGTTIHINRYPFTVIGVAPPAFRGSMAGENFQIWVPAGMLGQIVPTGAWWLRDRGTRTFRVLGRLAPGADVAAARHEVAALAERMAALNGEKSRGMSARVMPLWQSHWGLQDALRAPLGLLLGACALLLLIVCANTANLLLARSIGRKQELSLRLALGAPRGRLARQLLTETSLLGLGGCLLGVVCAPWLAGSLRWLVPEFAAPSLVEPAVDTTVLAFAGFLTAIVTLAAGVAPALHGSRVALAETLHEGGKGGSSGRGAVRLRSALVGAEIALAMISIVGAALFYQSFQNTRSLSPGFSADQVAMASVSLTLSGYDSARAQTFLSQVAERVHNVPGVSAVSYTDYVPLSVGLGSWEDLRVEGYAPQPDENMKLYRAAIGPEYFKTLEIPLVEGRDFTVADDSAHGPVMIVNEAFVRRFLNGRPALGVRVRGWGRWFTIVGVAKDTKVYRLTEPPTPYFYVPVRQVYRPEDGFTFLARSAMPSDQAVRTLMEAVKSADPTVPLFDAMPLKEYVRGPLQFQVAALQLLAVLVMLAVFLATIGLYGVIAYSVTQRTREIGVRIALGAQKTDVMRTVAMQAGMLLIVGLGAGVVGGVVLRRVVGAMLYAVGPADPTALAAAFAGIVVIALVATVIPARRATRVDPVIALKAE